MAATQKRTFVLQTLLVGTLLIAAGGTSSCRRSEACACRGSALTVLPPAAGSHVRVPEELPDADDAPPNDGHTLSGDSVRSDAAPIDDSRPAETSLERGPHGEIAAPCGEVPEGMACVPGGWFIRGLDTDAHQCDQASQPARGNVGTTPAQRIWMDTYYIDLTEVTNAAYKRCLDAGQCPKDGPKYSDFSAPQQPITGVSWYSARTYCQAQGKHLQTEAEFEKAARGPEGDLQPWGNAPATCDNAIIMDASGRSCGAKKKGNHPDNGRVSEVAQRPPGRYGIFDLVGNAEEWVADYWSHDYASCGEACRGPNPTGPCNGDEPCDGHRYRVVRGGSWYWPAAHATGYHRRAYRPNNEPPHHFGFRCAASIDEAQKMKAAP